MILANVVSALNAAQNFGDYNAAKKSAEGLIEADAWLAIDTLIETRVRLEMLGHLGLSDVPPSRPLALALWLLKGTDDPECPCNECLLSRTVIAQAAKIAVLTSAVEK